jgi:hypothetical protein
LPHNRLREAWQVRDRAFPVLPALTLAPEGLTLGAGTVLVPAHGARRPTSLDRQEARVLALLSAAYDKAVAPAVLALSAGTSPSRGRKRSADS